MAMEGVWQVGVDSVVRKLEYCSQHQVKKGHRKDAAGVGMKKKVSKGRKGIIVANDATARPEYLRRRI